MDSEAEKINEAVNNVLTSGFKSKDLIGNNEQNLSTQQMGDKIVEAYNNLGSK